MWKVSVKSKRSGKLRSAAGNCKQGKCINVSDDFRYSLNHLGGHSTSDIREHFPQYCRLNHAFGTN